MSGSNYDGYYYYYSGERNPEYNYDAIEDKDKETFGEWLTEFWSHTTNKVITLVVGAIVSCSCLLFCVLSFSYYKDRFQESAESKKYREANQLVKVKSKPEKNRAVVEY